MNEWSQPAWKAEVIQLIFSLNLLLLSFHPLLLLERFSLKARKWLRNDAEFLKQQHSFFLPQFNSVFSLSTLSIQTHSIKSRLIWIELKFDLSERERSERERREVWLSLRRLIPLPKIGFGISQFSNATAERERKSDEEGGDWIEEI